MTALNQYREEIRNAEPVDGIPIAPAHYLELKAWRMPNGSRFVQLIDDSEETWENYCRLLVKRSAEIAQRRKEVA